ncbi:CotH kinase family protein [Aquimarina sp. SS2-1]|uniref:CotH kinase family protein n=1 Tax=Aquimarina besae TaxID=3342247 RepID=UPI003673361D
MKLKAFILLTLLYCTQVQSQNIYTINVEKEYYGIDKTHKLIVWNTDISKYENADFNTIEVSFDSSVTFKEEVNNLSYTTSFQVEYQNEIFKLYLTELPLIKIKTSKQIKDDPKVAANFSYAELDTIKTALTGIEYRGNISLKFPKKSYDLEFWDDPKDKTSRDMQFGKLRNDDDWILDGLYNEPLRLRSYFCNKLWLSIHQPKYLDQEKNAKSGIDLMYTEVFIDDNYVGIYALTEQVDRKLLQLKKYKKKMVYGELFKAASYEGAPSYKSVPKYNNIFPHWAGYEMEYPFVNYKSHWKDIYKFTKFVIKSKDETFKKKIAKKFYLDNAIDYFLFVNLIRATDNLGKNFYVARYNKKEPYFNVPWDLDGVLGTIQDGKKIPTTDDILSNGLFDRLLEVNPDNYRQRLKDRWFSLRETALSNQQLFDNLRKRYLYFDEYKLYEREILVWQADQSMSEHFKYLESWLAKRLIFLDAYFKKLE